MRGAVNLALLIIVVNAALAWVIAKDPLLGYMIVTAAGIALMIVGIALVFRSAFRRLCRLNWRASK